LNAFDVLLVANALLAIVALYQLRICTFILCGNNLLVARALGSIDRFGPPASQLFIPGSVFSPENLSTAAWILTLSLATLAGFTIITIRQRVRIGPDAPAIPRFVLVAIAIYLLAFVGATRTILVGEYGTDSNIRYDLELAGGHAFLCSIIIYELARYRLLGKITASRAFLLLFISLGITNYLKGATGITTGILLTGAILLLPRTGAAKRIQNVFRIGLSLLFIIFFSLVIRGTRTNLFSDGTDAVGDFISGILQKEDSRDDSGEGAESEANANQSATHMLTCITLYDSGISRQWRSIYDVVEYTFIPSFFVRYLGWTRSIDPPTELREHFYHGGGINVLGEFYWNGGWLCVVIMVTAMSLFCAVIDIRYRSSPFWLMMVSQFGPSFLMGYGYGFSQVSRGAINCLVAAGIYKVFISLRGASSPLVTTPTVKTTI